MAEARKIEKDMEVIGADGVHVGIVDHMDGDRIKLKRKDEAHGIERDHHHFVPLANVASVDGGRVRLSAKAADAKILMEEKDGSGVEGV